MKDSSFQNTAMKASTPAKVTITKVFDFAGEEVRYSSVSSSHFQAVFISYFSKNVFMLSFVSHLDGQ